MADLPARRRRALSTRVLALALLGGAGLWGAGLWRLQAGADSTTQGATGEETRAEAPAPAAEAPEPQVGAPGGEAGPTLPPQPLLALLQEAGERMHHELAQTRAYERYLECHERTGEDCDRLWSTAVSITISRHFEEARTKALAAQLHAEYGRDELEAAVRERMLQSDPLARIATLAVLRADANLQDIELPADAYAGLRDRSTVESVLILRRVVALPDSGVALEVQGLALDPAVDWRVRSSAATRLAMLRERPLLAEILERWLMDEERTPAAEQVRGLLQACGDACSRLSARMAQDTRPEIRALLDATASST